MAVWVYLIALLVVLFWCYAKWQSGYFQRKGVKNLPYDFYIAGNTLKFLLLKEHLKDATSRVYKAFPDERYVGYKQIDNNMILIRDIELLRNLAIKDFDNFSDRLMTVNEEVDDLFGRNLASLKGNKWREMRATLSPAFTSSKIKAMFQFTLEVAEQMTSFYTSECNENGLAEVEMMDAFTRYTNDAIATSAFGFQVNSFKDKNNIFFRIGKDVSKFSGMRYFKFLIYSNFTFLTKIINCQLYSDEIKSFFRNTVLGTMKHRENQNIVRKDMIHLLAQAKKGCLKHKIAQNDNLDEGFATTKESHVGRQIVETKWSDDDIAAQGLVFYAAGLETSSSLLCFIVHELALHQDIQQRLQEEIDQAPVSEDGKIVYNDLNNLAYMDMVVCETLRKWPPISQADRICNNDYTLPPPSKESSRGYTMRKNESIMIPIYAIHHDPKYFPDPEKFDPERFSDENKTKINPLSYIPFGIGPRNCIASRYGLMVTKTIIFYLLKKFNFVKISRTEDPIILSPKFFTLTAENGFWIGLQLRN